VRKQENEAAFGLAKAGTFMVSFQILVEISYCIEYILSNEMLQALLISFKKKSTWFYTMSYNWTK